MQSPEPVRQEPSALMQLRQQSEEARRQLEEVKQQACPSFETPDPDSLFDLNHIWSTQLLVVHTFTFV